MAKRDCLAGVGWTSSGWLGWRVIQDDEQNMESCVSAQSLVPQGAGAIHGGGETR
ncbi:hypothetical protein PCA20602_04131 [Pandoraea capi]|uniref:Uncharacterized protein n=1 Tax=Pandoraea capi TaxID=2508286 RepID=A0ABY6W8P6_9BURK|nr:hypothetical protein PCA20602_04131 [Pandoraea capi]